MSKPLAWRQLALQTPMTPEAAAAFLTALATMPGAPRLVLEAVGRSGGVSWRIGGDENVLRQVDSLLATHLPASRLSDDGGQPAAVVTAASLRLPGHRTRPLRLEATERTNRSVLTALTEARGRELIRLQVVLGARTKPRRAPDSEAHERRVVRATFAEHGFGCTVRVATTAIGEGRARRLVSSLAAALRPLEVPGVRVVLRRTTSGAVMEARSPWLWPLWLSVHELVPLLGWPVGELPLPGVAPAHPRLLPASTAVPSTGRMLGRASAADTHRPVALSFGDSLRHLHVLGPTGTGKSTLLAQLALSDMTAGHGLVVIDPKGDLVEDLLARVPAKRRDDVVVLDPTDEAPVGINPLVGGEPELRADGLLSVFHQLYRDNWGPRTHDILHACLLSLARRGDASLIMVPLLLTNPGFRRSVVGSVAKRDPMGLGSFWTWFDAISAAEREAAIAPLMNKLRPVLLRPGLRAVFGQRQPKFDLNDVFTKRRILLVSLAKGRLGQDGAALLGSVVVAMLWQAALARVALPADKRWPVMVFIDEVQDYLRLPDDLGDALAQARSLGVGFTLAHQHLDQLPVSIRAAVLANARSRVCFQLAAKDAAVMAAGSQLNAEDFTSLPAFQAYARLLVDNSPEPWLSLTTQPLPEATVSARKLRVQSRQEYGRPLSDVEADWATLANQSGAQEPLGRTPRKDAS